MIWRNGKAFTYTDILTCSQASECEAMVKQLTDELAGYFAVSPPVVRWRVVPHIGDAVKTAHPPGFAIAVVARGWFE